MKKVDEILEKMYRRNATEDEIAFLRSHLSEAELNQRLQLMQDLEEVYKWEEVQSARHFVSDHIENNNARLSFWKWSGFWMAILVAIGLSLAAYFLLFNTTEQEVKVDKADKAYAAYYSPLKMELEPVTRGRNTTSSIKDIQELYLSHDYQSLITQSADSDKSNILLYRGLSFMEVEQWNEAEGTFNILQKSSDKILIKEIASWYNALVSLKQDDISEAQERLKRIKSAEQHTYKKKATALFKSIAEKQVDLRN